MNIVCITRIDGWQQTQNTQSEKLLFFVRSERKTCFIALHNSHIKISQEGGWLVQPNYSILIYFNILVLNTPKPQNPELNQASWTMTDS